MKHIGLSLGLPLLALLGSVAAPRAAAAHDSRGRDHVPNHAGRPTHGGWQAARPAPRVVAPARVVPAHPVRAVRADNHAALGRWGWHGPTRVWFGVATARPYTDWSWTPAQWVWNGTQWIWQEGYWAPPV